uniref:Uncharacterized protein n=1 Tax=Nelumbo nucifera TaxID=4432 RepID=A0A822XIE4_NELNU|nr:TPA_asm: hypothetical protein HUJ06_021215 [Nelumbo nucifera]
MALPHDVNLFNLGTGSAKDKLMVPLPAPIKGEISSTEFNRKRKPTDENPWQRRITNSPYENVRTGFGISNFEITEDKPVVLSLPFEQPKPAAPPLNPTQSTFSLSGLGLPEDGQKTISKHM